MEAVILDMESRLSEVEEFLRFLKKVEKSARLARPEFAGANASTLKACAFLLIYNVVESCVRSSFEECYAAASAEGLNFSASSDQFRKIWLRQRMDIPADSANLNTYLTEADGIAIAVCNFEPLSLSARKLQVSGNLSADKVRELCLKHGVALKVNKWAKGGVELNTIKEQRNALSHGHKTFTECGRDYTTEDLERIFRETRHFLKGFVRSVRAFNTRRGYKRTIRRGRPA